MTEHPAPEHLSSDMKTWWAQVHRDWEMDPHHRYLLQLACEAWDECQTARKAREENGLSYTDRFGQPKLRPEVQVEQNAAIRFARLVRELQLDRAPDTSPPPRLY